MSERQQSPEHDHEPGHDPDQGSDPAHRAADEGSDDWSSEGGAVSEGPATHPADADPEDTPT